MKIEHKRYTLILSCTFQPLSCQSVRTTMRYLINGQGRALDPETGMLYSFDDWIELYNTQNSAEVTLRSEKIWMLIPEIVVLDKSYSRHKRAFKHINPDKIFERDNHTCGYCGKFLANRKDRTLDHVHPQSKGGPDTYENLVTCCKSCNNKKGNSTLNQLGWKLLHKLLKPQDTVLFNVPKNKWLDSWRGYLKQEMTDFE